MSPIYRFADVQDEVLGWLDETGATGTSLTNVKNAINQAHLMRCAQEAWPFLKWDGPETFTLTATDRYYSLHPEFWRPDYFWNRDAKEFLIEVPGRSVPMTGERWQTDTGRTPYFRWAGVMSVATQPTSTSVVTIVSSSASDTTAAKALTIDGISSGVRTTESITPNGVTPVAGTTSFTKVLGVTKAADWVGTATLTTNSAAVTILSLLPTEYGRQYRQLELLRAPTAADVIEYVFYRVPKKLVNDYDIPDIPAPHSQILVWDALLLFSGYNTDTSGSALKTWVGMQQGMEEDMRRVWLEGASLEAAPRYVRSLDGAAASSHIFNE